MLELYAALSGMDVRDRRRRIPELLDLVGLNGWSDVRIKKYSKGMLQRLGLAQALIHRPRLLILDEPTDGVDPLGRRQIREILNGLLGTGVTIFINSHLLAEVEAFCDDVAIIDRGRLALQGHIRDLIAGRGYKLTAHHVSPELRRHVSATDARGSGEDDKLEMQLGTREELNRAIDALRQGDALIESVLPTVSTLEDVFIRTNGRLQCSKFSAGRGGRVIGSHAHSTSRVVVALVADTFQEARARWLFWGLFGLSTLLIAFFLFVLRIDVVGGAVSLLGIDQTSRHFYSLERVVRFAYAKVAMFLYVWETFLAIFASAGLTPSILESGRIGLLLSKPISRPNSVARALSWQHTHHHRQRDLFNPFDMDHRRAKNRSVVCRIPDHNPDHDSDFRGVALRCHVDRNCF